MHQDQDQNQKEIIAVFRECKDLLKTFEKCCSENPQEDKRKIDSSQLQNVYWQYENTGSLQREKLFSFYKSTALAPYLTETYDSMRFRFVTEIGKGAHGKISLYHDTHKCLGEQCVAVKTNLQGSLVLKNHDLNELLALTLLKKNPHPHLVHMEQCILLKNCVRFVLPYFFGGNITELFNRSPEIQARFHLKKIMFQILSAIHHLHTMNIYHGDVKCNNIVFDTPLLENIKIIDMGHAEINFDHRIDKNPNTMLCPKSLRPPEYFCPQEKDSYDPFKVDIWHLGMIMLQCANLQSIKITRQEDFPPREYVEKIQKKLPQEGYEIMSQWLLSNPSERPDSKVSLQSSFFICFFFNKENTHE